MQPDDTHLIDLIHVYEGSFQEPLTLEEARDLYDRLLDLYARLKRVPPEWHEPEAGNYAKPATLTAPPA